MAKRPCFDADIVVAGAGVVGLAIARAFALAGREVLILEAERAFGTITSARNSEVIHAGIYYPQGSLKAMCCTRGRRALYTYLRERRLPFRQCGKIIVATNDAEAAELEGIAARAEANGVEQMRPLDRKDMTRTEPALVGTAGLLSATTGIIDSHTYMRSLLGDAEDHGAALALETVIEHGESNVIQGNENAKSTVGMPLPQGYYSVPEGCCYLGGANRRQHHHARL